MKSIYASLTLSLVLVANAGPAFAADAPDPFARDIKILTNWFEGEFDNEEQRWFQNHPYSKTPEDKRHSRLHVMHRRLDLPSFGEHVFYVEEYKDHDPEKLVRQRFVIFQSDLESKAIRMRQGFFKDTEKAKGAYFNPDKLKDLKPSDVQFMEDIVPESQCDIFWKRVAGQFEGRITDKACVFGEGAKERYSIHTMQLSEDKYWRSDLTRLVADDSISVGHPENEPHQMRRAKRFICNGTFRGATSTFSDGKSEEQKFSNQSIHSQGGTFQIKRNSDGKMIEVLLRTKEYPFYSDKPDFLYFSVREAGSPRSLAFTVNDIQSRRVGVTIGGISTSCHREGYTFDEPIDQF